MPDGSQGFTLAEGTILERVTIQKGRRIAEVILYKEKTNKDRPVITVTANTDCYSLNLRPTAVADVSRENRFNLSSDPAQGLANEMTMFPENRSFRVTVKVVSDLKTQDR